MSTGKKIVIASSVGILVGAVVGLAFAPYKGSKTRRKVARKGSNTLKDVKNIVEDVKNKITHLMDSMDKNMKKQKNEVANTYGSVKSKVEEVSKDGKVAPIN